jgi:Protein of unknown function (DUF3604)
LNGSHHKKALRFHRIAKGIAWALLGMAGAAAGTLALGIVDYLYDPEYFRPGKKPDPSRETAPGEAEVTPAIIRAGGGAKTVTLTLRCGPGGISEGGSVKVGLCRLVDFQAKGRRAVFLYANGWGALQNRHPRLPNYYTCEARTSGRARLEVAPQGYFPWRGALRYMGRETLRRCGVRLDPLDLFYLFMEQRKICMAVRDDRLQEGDEIVITLGDTRRGSRGWSSPAHPSRSDLAVEVDEKAMGKPRFISENPVLEVAGREAVGLSAVLSSIPEGSAGRLVLRAVDDRGDVDPTFTGEVELSPSPGMEIPARVKFRDSDRGVIQVSCRADAPGIHRVRADAGELTGSSNPVLFGGEFRFFWGDIHAHSALCDGTLEPAEFYRTARDISGLDFAAITTHDTMAIFEPSGRKDEWELVRKLKEEYNQPGRFVTFLGYEWSEHKQGHRGVYFAPDEPDPHMYGWTDPASDTSEKLEATLGDHEVMVVPHHTAWRRIFLALFNWLKFIRMRVPKAYTWWGSENEQQRLAEVYSMHGSSERYDGPYPITHGKPRGWFPRFLRDDRSAPGYGNYIQEALASGLRLGLIAGSDRHDYAVSERFHPIDIYTAGLTAVWADDLTDASLWRSLWNRRVYGTTGARIILELFADGLPMGSEYVCISAPRLHGSIVGTAPVRLAELLRHDDRGYDTIWSSCGEGSDEVSFDFVDTDLRGEAFYYLRVEQEDVHCAWSSPIWILR